MSRPATEWNMYHTSFMNNGNDYIMPIFMRRSDTDCQVSLWTELTTNEDHLGTCRFENSLTIILDSGVEQTFDAVDEFEFPNGRE